MSPQPKRTMRYRALPMFVVWLLVLTACSPKRTEVNREMELLFDFVDPTDSDFSFSYLNVTPTPSVAQPKARRHSTTRRPRSSSPPTTWTNMPRTTTDLILRVSKTRWCGATHSVSWPNCLNLATALAWTGRGTSHQFATLSTWIHRQILGTNHLVAGRSLTSGPQPTLRSEEPRKFSSHSVQIPFILMLCIGRHSSSCKNSYVSPVRSSRIDIAPILHHRPTLWSTPNRSKLIDACPFPVDGDSRRGTGVSVDVPRMSAATSERTRVSPEEPAARRSGGAAPRTRISTLMSRFWRMSWLSRHAVNTTNNTASPARRNTETGGRNPDRWGSLGIPTRSAYLTGMLNSVAPASTCPT